MGYEPAKYFNDFLGFDTEAMGEYPLPLEISSSIRQAEAMLGQYITIGRVLANKVQKVIAPWYPDVLKPFADSSQTLDRAGRAYESLLAIQKMGEPIDVQTGLRLYKNMMLTSIGATQDKPGAVEFSLNLEEVFIVESQTVKGLHPDLKQQPQKSNMGRTQPEAKSAHTFRETLGGTFMIYEIPVSNEPIQEQLFTLFGKALKLTLYYNKISKNWQFDLFDINENKVITQMQGLAVNAPSLIEKNLPFIFTLSDKSRFGINSISQSELGERLLLYIVDKGFWYETIRQTT
ncbi:hypothetical protein PY546_09535 [Providencia stuartii]|nr:hypothetical protein [Providencia stuartii]